MRSRTLFEAKVGWLWCLIYDAKLYTELWQARFNDDLGYVLILTHFKAVVWRYAQFNDHRETSRVYTVKLPQASSKPRDTLPLGTLIHDSVAGEMALLVLQNNGKINYWESVPGAAHADAMRQKQQAIQSSLSGLFSGEVISDITDAEPDGFILTSNASRIIHLSVRGPQGKLSISTEVLRGNSAIGSGFLNGIRSVFSSSGWRKDIAAARCASLQGKSHRKCIVVTKQCVFQIWDLRRHSTKTLEAEIDAKQIILDSIQSQSDNSRHEELQAIDFTFFPVYRNEQRDSQHLLLLVELKSPTSSRNFLVDLSLFGDALDINLLHRITCSDQISGDERPWLASRSRILLPHPAHSAIVVYDAAYVMVSLARVEDGPSSQLQRESHLLSEPFQDMLFFARERDFHVLGCASQSQSSESDHASFLMFVNNFGLVQTSITRAKEDEEPSVRRTTLCQSKIEQAVFFGDIPTRLFDFVRSSSIVDWQVEEIEQAALRINDSILASTSPYISVLNPSLENQLKDRSTALRELSKFIVRWSLGESVRWQLLWSAEKMAAARAIWQVYSTHLANRDEQQIDHNGENIVLLREAIEMISEKFKHVPHPEQGETDIVRHYFINDIANIELLIPWAAHALSELYREGLHDTVKQALLVNQANDIQINALETAFAFREQSAEMYGISKVSVEDGIYTGSYHSLPDFWTSCLENVVKVKDLAILSRECAIENEDPPEEGENVLDIAVLLKLARDAARLANLTCLIFEERYRTLQGRDDEESQSTLLNFEQKCLATRKELTVGLVDVELPEEGIRIAEKYNDVAALAEVITRSLAVIFDRMTDSDADPDEIIELRTKKNQYLEKTKMYFEKYGLRWADAFYSLRMQYPDSIPTLLKENDILMKEFLESKPELLKLKWMHEVGSQREFNGAAQDLLNLNSAEANLWNKKVELSMAKLSIFAAKEAQQANDDAVQRSARNADRRLAAIEVQELLYDYTRPVLGSALDRTAEVDLAMQTYGIALKKKPVLAESLRHSLEKLVKREALSEEGLVDILTLMHCPSQVLDDADVAGRRFFLALRVASTSAVEDEAFARFQQQTIWRRCVLQDNWEAINNTEYKADEAVSKETEGTALFKTLLAGFSEGKANPICKSNCKLTVQDSLTMSPLWPHRTLLKMTSILRLCASLQSTNLRPILHWRVYAATCLARSRPWRRRCKREG